MTKFPDDDDGVALAGIEARGIDMTKPIKIEFAIDVPDEPVAGAVSKALVENGYHTETLYDEGEPDENGVINPDDEEFGPAWTVYVHLEMIPRYEDVIRVQADLDRIVDPLGGKSDGWGTLID